MKTIKIIDLLTNRANGEGGIKKFRYHNVIWKLNILDYAYYNDSGVEFENWVDGDLMNCLNEELEILDEEDEFEDIEEMNLNALPSQNCINSEIEIIINQLIKNQKKIIEWIESEKKKS